MLMSTLILSSVRAEMGTMEKLANIVRHFMTSVNLALI